ncbi:MAG: serine/threonine protein kinase [Deltaproteobacteria bacterium]|nr:serine/threonine protein kinase [Deltaproteobacteria bacterium]
MRPQPFGRYQLLDRISSGGMAEVFLAKTQGVRGFEKVLAIKRILPLVAEDADFQTMFVDEAQISAHLTHANVAQVLEFGQIEGQYFIAMEYVAGRDLRALRTRLAETGRHMPVDMALHIAARVCQGLDYAHRQKFPDGRSMEIIHRDVSPPNILISYEGQVKIIDFGIAKAASRSTRTRAGKLKGKFAYMSPEQVEGVQLDHRSDIFAVGIVLYEMLTNRRPFEGENQLATLNLVRKAVTDPPSTVNPEVPLEVDRIVARALMRKADERYGWASELRADIERYFGRAGTAFETHHLADWMKREFAGEVEAERRLMQRISQLQADDDAEVKAPSVDGGASRRGRDPRDLTPAIDLDQPPPRTEALAPTADARSLDAPLPATQAVTGPLPPVRAKRATPEPEPLPPTGRRQILPAATPSSSPSRETMTGGDEGDLQADGWHEPTTLDESDTGERPNPPVAAPGRPGARAAGGRGAEGRTNAWVAPTEKDDDEDEPPETSQHAALLSEEELEEDASDEDDEPVDELPMGKTTVLHRGSTDDVLAHLPTMAVPIPGRGGDEADAGAQTRILPPGASRPRVVTGPRASVPRPEHRGGAQVSGVVESLADDFEEMDAPAPIRKKARTDRLGREGRGETGKKKRRVQNTAVGFGEGVRRALSRLTSTQIVVLVASATLVFIGLAVLVGLLVADSSTEGSSEGTGSLIITSSPPAACTVGIDDRPRGLLSPGASMTLAGVPAGPHAVSLTCVGYKPFSRAALVNASQVTLVEAQLQRE